MHPNENFSSYTFIASKIKPEVIEDLKPSREIVLAPGEYNGMSVHALFHSSK